MADDKVTLSRTDWKLILGALDFYAYKPNYVGTHFCTLKSWPWGLFRRTIIVTPMIMNDSGRHAAKTLRMALAATDDVIKDLRHSGIP